MSRRPGPQGFDLDEAPASANYETRMIQLAKHVSFFAVFLGVAKAVALAVPGGSSF